MQRNSEKNRKRGALAEVLVHRSRGAVSVFGNRWFVLLQNSYGKWGGMSVDEASSCNEKGSFFIFLKILL